MDLLLFLTFLFIVTLHHCSTYVTFLHICSYFFIFWLFAVFVSFFFFLNFYCCLKLLFLVKFSVVVDKQLCFVFLSYEFFIYVQVFIVYV
jgi:hypothetical protein